MPVFPRLALAIATLIVALLVTTTAQAQSALPGDGLYNWKRTSERVWRAVSTDVVAVDIEIANRRIEELQAVADNPELSASAMEGYLEVLQRLETIENAESLAVIVPVIQSHQQVLIEVSGTVANAPLNHYLISETEDFSTQASAVVASANVAVVLPSKTATLVPPAPTATQVPPTATEVPPTATEVPPTATEVPPTPTVTEVPPTATEIPPTATEIPPTPTEVPPTATEAPPTATEAPPVPTEVPPGDTPTPEPPILPQSGSQ